MSPDTSTETRVRAEDAASALAKATGVLHHDVALVMGSGWAEAADALGDATAEIPMADVPGFVPPVVQGHGGAIRSVSIGGKRALVFLGRTHLYEGRGVAALAHGVRTAAAAGADLIVLTNAAGGLRHGMRPGQPVMISDHLNLTGVSPIAGANFIDLTDMYSGCCGRWAPTWSECPPCWRPSQPGKRGWKFSGCPWSPTWPPA